MFFAGGDFSGGDFILRHRHSCIATSTKILNSVRGFFAVSKDRQIDRQTVELLLYSVLYCNECNTVVGNCRTDYAYIHYSVSTRMVTGCLGPPNLYGLCSVVYCISTACVSKNVHFLVFTITKSNVDQF